MIHGTIDVLDPEVAWTIVSSYIFSQSWKRMMATHGVCTRLLTMLDVSNALPHPTIKMQRRRIG